LTGTPEDLKRAVRASLQMSLDPDILNPFSHRPDREAVIKARIREALTPSEGTRSGEPLVAELYNELVGLGPLQPFMDDPAVSDILVNRFDDIYIERSGRLEATTARFRDQAHLEQVIQKIVALVGREINVDKPIADARMPDGSRANAVFAPVGGPTLCIRKFNRLRLALTPRPGPEPSRDWVTAGGMSLPMARFLEAMAVARANVLIAGATGSGKSTLLRSLVSTFPTAERVITIEDTAELDLENPHWVRLECVHSKELAGKTTQERRLDVADLVQNALRMRPDRLIIGEIRHSKEAYYTLEALNTGHDGSATTIHASSCWDALARIELLVSRDFGQLSSQEIRGYVARVIDLVVFVARLRDGRRCLLEICELRGLSEDHRYDLRPIFRAEFPHQAQELPEPEFSRVLEEPLGPRLQRKLELQGTSWT
jgi:pilus assembly protein CpaF